MRHFPLIVILFLLCIVTPLAAQDATTDTGWPIEQHCVGDPTPPPADWSYDGTIFSNDGYGIRALNPTMQEPYFVIFGDSFINGASLTPDGKWYAVPTGRTEYANMTSQHYIVDAIMVYSTNGKRTTYRIPWNEIFWFGGGNYVVEPIHWIDNNHFIYTQTNIVNGQIGWFKVNPFTQDIVKIDESMGLLSLYPSVSPDLSLVISNQTNEMTGDRTWGLYEANALQIIKILGVETYNQASPFRFPVRWLPDSSHFFATILEENSLDSDNSKQWSLVLFNRDGSIDQQIYQNNSSMKYEVSPNAMYLAFYDENSLYLANLQTAVIRDLCVRVSTAYSQNLAWSSNSRQLSFTSEFNVVVFDIERDDIYSIASDAGGVIAWGAAD